MAHLIWTQCRALVTLIPRLPHSLCIHTLHCCASRKNLLDICTNWTVLKQTLFLRLIKICAAVHTRLTSALCHIRITNVFVCSNSIWRHVAKKLYIFHLNCEQFNKEMTAIVVSLDLFQRKLYYLICDASKNKHQKPIVSVDRTLFSTASLANILH